MAEHNRRKELALAGDVGITAHTAEHLATMFELPKKLRGLQALDIGTGLSDFAYWLRRKGAEAYGFDLTYALGMERMIADSLERAQADVEREPEAYTFTQAMAETFRRSLATPPAFYVAGSALNLPFRNGRFDLVTSNLGIFGTLDHDYPMLVHGVAEALRVTKKRGRLQLAPVYYRARTFDTQECAANQRQLISALKRDNRFQVTDKMLGLNLGIGEVVGRLVITKI